jgi:uncharacterized protein
MSSRPRPPARVWESSVPELIHLLLCGVSTRAAAESAARAGLRVTAIDGYADLDQHPAVRALSVSRDFGLATDAESMARASLTVTCDAVAYLSNFENHPRALSVLTRGRALWGNDAAVLRRVRNPLTLATTLARRGFAVPQVALRPDVNSRGESNEHSWLVKPVRSGGGQGVRPWAPAARVPRGCYLQERIDGTPGSVVFVAAGGRAVPLGVSRQLVGEAAFGAGEYRYCGSIIAAVDDPQFDGGHALVQAACELARVAAAEFGLTGLNGIDFIARGGVPHPIEVNPRWSSSMELVERLFGLSVFGAHASACMRGTLPPFDVTTELRRVRAVGKAIVYAGCDGTVGDTTSWLSDSSVRDVPHPGDPFTAGQPVCTVFAEARDAQECFTALVGRAAAIRTALTPASDLVNSLRRETPDPIAAADVRRSRPGGRAVERPRRP